MRAYAGLAEEKYELPVYPVLINILEASSETIANSFQSNFAGLKAIQEYRVINLWEVDVDIVFQRNLSTLLPLVPIMKGRGEEKVIRRALGELRLQQQPQELESILGFFATYFLDTSLVQEILRCDMAILEQSPLYREIVERSEQRGMERGIQQVATNMLRIGISREQVSEATGLSVEQVARLLEKSDLSE